MIQTYNPPHMDINEDTIPELQPIFTFLNSHQNKLYQEGYFLKLDDQDPAETQTQTGHGPNALPSWLAQFCRYGMPPSLMRLERRVRYCPSSLT